MAVITFMLRLTCCIRILPKLYRTYAPARPKFTIVFCYVHLFHGAWYDYCPAVFFVLRGLKNNFLVYCFKGWRPTQSAAAVVSTNPKS